MISIVEHSMRAIWSLHITVSFIFFHFIKDSFILLYFHKKLISKFRKTLLSILVILSLSLSIQRANSEQNTPVKKKTLSHMLISSWQMFLWKKWEGNWIGKWTLTRFFLRGLIFADFAEFLVIHENLSPWIFPTFFLWKWIHAKFFAKKIQIWLNFIEFSIIQFF